MSYTVVHFKEENSIEGVPSTWLIKVNNKICCYWPPKKACWGLTGLIKRCVSPDLSWKLSKCSIIFKADSYFEMREKCKEAQYLTGSEATEKEVSDESEVVNESDSSEELPSPPKKKKSKSNYNNQIELEENNSESITQPMPINVSGMNDMYIVKLKTLEEQNDRILKSNSEIFKHLLDTREEVKILKKMIRKNSTSVSLESSSKLPQLPIQTKDALLQLEEVLQDDCEKLQLTRRLSNFGGSQLRGTVNNIMKNALAPSVASSYSMQGKGTKLSFMELKLCSCVQEAILLSPLGKGAALCDLNKFIAIYLAQAKDKMSRRKRPGDRVTVLETVEELPTTP